MRWGAVALGLGGGLVGAALLAVPACEALDELRAARQVRMSLAARIAVPPAPARPIVAPELAISGRDGATAARSLAGRIRGSAASAGVLVEALTLNARQPGIVTLRVRLSGREKAVIAMIDGIERGTPLTRFRSWRATALADGGVRVEGDLVAAWQ